MGENHEYPLRLHAKDCDYYMRNGTCKFKMNCKYNHPVRRPNQRPCIPKFGSWENNEGVPYTMCFENARNGRNGENMINPSYPEEILKASSPRTREPNGQPVSGLVYNHRVGREDKEPRQYPECLSDYNARATGLESSHQRHVANVLVSNEIPKCSTRPNTASENKFNRPPPHEQANGLWRDVNPPSPSQEEENLNVIRLGTPRGSQMNPSTQGNYSPDRGAAIPKFGLWNNDNPESGDDYTAVFSTHTKQVEEQNGERTRAQMEVKSSVSPSNDINMKRDAKKKTKIRCFPWFKK